MSRIHEALARAQQQRAENDAQPSPKVRTVDGELRQLASEPDLAPGVGYGDLLANCTQASWQPDTAKMLFASDNRHSGYGREQFRTLRSRLFQAQQTVSLKSILVASGLPGEGRSFVATNLAQALAQQQDRRVVLIDADLRSPALHRYLGAPSTPGISEYLRGEVSETAVLQQSQIERFWFVPGGKAGDNPTELLGSPRMAQLFDHLSACFDWMIVDSSPAIPVSDASLLARLCNGVLLVVAAGATPQEMARKARAMFDGGALLGVVLNRADGLLDRPTNALGEGEYRSQ
jgi:protein-tyrosine kinase